MRPKPRLYQDPIHGLLALERDDEAGRLLARLVDTPEVQRLRQIRQLGLAHLVFHGAEHSRFAHSLGVMALARRMLTELARAAPIAARQAMVTQAAALLHDLGHAPLSHALEAVTGARHEVHSAGLCLHPDSGVHAALRDVDSALPEAVAGCLRGEAPQGAPFLGQIVSSQLDADRLDYILRDAHATGVKLGAYDLPRILAMLEVDADGQLAVHAGARQAVEGYLLARFHMYTQVYLHRTCRVAERMLEAALARASELRREGSAPRYWPPGPLGTLLRGDPLEAPELVRLTDADVWVALAQWAGEPDRALADLAGGLVRRRLFKALDASALPAERAAEIVLAARAVARVRGYDAARHVLLDEAGDAPYRAFTGMGDGSRSIRLVDARGRSAPIEDRSELVKMLGRLEHQQRLLVVHPELRAPISRLLPG